MAETSDGRARWGKWIALTSGLLLLLFLLFHAVWGVTNKRYLFARVEQLRRAGEPMLPADFVAAKVAPSQNGAVELEQAVGMIRSNGAAWKAYNEFREPIRLPMRPEEREAVEAILADSAEALALVEQAHAKPSCVMDLNLRSPFFISSNLSNLNGLRSLCHVLAEGALLDHERGNDADALRRLDRILFISRYPDQYPQLVSHLVAIGCTSLVSDRMAQITPDLKVGSGPTDASPQALRELIEALLNDKTCKEGFVRSLRGERMGELDMVQAWTTGLPTPGFMPGPTSTPFSPISRYFLKPAFYRSARVLLEQMTTQINLASSADDWPTVRANLPPMPKRTVLNSFVMMILPSLDRAMETHFRGLTERHLAATALAIRWYALEHDGQLPRRLEDLVPNYLPMLPADPMAEHATPLHYLPEANPPAVYSVGSDGIDNGGSLSPNPVYARMRRAQPPDDWNMQDRVLSLIRKPRPTTDESN